MGLLSFLKEIGKPSDDFEKAVAKPPEPVKQEKSEEERIITLQFDDTVDPYMAKITAQRLNESAPVLTRGTVDESPEMLTTRFNFDDVLIATVHEKYKSYLLDGINAASFIRDFDYINEFAHMANEEIEGLPDFSICRFDTAFEPSPNLINKNWNYSRIVFPHKTPTGKQRKYPFYISWQTLSNVKSGKFYYDQYGLIGKGEIYADNPDKESGIYSYGMDFVNGKLSHIWANSEKEGKRYIYNKNEKKQDGTHGDGIICFVRDVELR